MAQGDTTASKSSNTMAAGTPPKTPSKRGTGAGSTSDIDTIVPLLFAANPGITPNYNKMSAMDEHGRTASALEHKFRKWRQVGRDILAAHPEEAATDKVVGQPAKTKNPRSAVKKGKQANGGGMIADDESFDEMVNGKTGVKKQDEDSDDGETKKSSPKKRGAATNTGDESPTKKSKARQNSKTAATKKSTAAKKASPSSQLPVTDNATHEDVEGIAVKEEDEYVSANEGETDKVELSFEKV